MFRALRKARFGQIALMIAGFLAVGGSFGLHPEPRAALSAGIGATAAPTLASGSGGVEASHDCLACLAHKSLSLPRPAAVVLQPGSAVTPRTVTEPALLSRLEAHPREGRAPPALV